MTDVITCPVCAREFTASGAAKTVYPTIKNNGSVRPFREICFCPFCEAGVAFPPMSEDQLDALYATGDYWQQRKSRAFLPRLYPGPYANAMARWQYVKKTLALPPQASLSVLDIGGGHGFFGAVIARDKSVRLQRYEIVEKDLYFQESLKITWQKLYPEVGFAVWPDLTDVRSHYHLVVLSHVLEHVNRPQQMLQRASERLAPGGHILADVPCQDYLFKQDVFPHVVFFQPQHLSLLCVLAGLSPVAIGCFGINRNPARARRIADSRSLLERLAYKLRRILPVRCSAWLYNQVFKPGIADPQGIWIRSLMRKT